MKRALQTNFDSQMVTDSYRGCEFHLPAVGKSDSFNKNYKQMKGNATIEQTLECMDHSVVKKVISFPLKSTMLFTLGILLIELDTQLPPALKADLTPLIAIAAMIVMFWGFIIGLVDKVYYKYMLTGNKVEFREVMFEKGDYKKLKEIVESQNFSRLSSLRKTSNNGIKLKIAYTEDMSLGLVQVIRYIPFDFAEKTQPKQLEKNKMEELLQIIN